MITTLALQKGLFNLKALGKGSSCTIKNKEQGKKKTKKKTKEQG